MKLNRRIFEKLFLSFVKSKTTNSLGFPNGNKNDIRYDYSKKFNDKNEFVFRLTISNKNCDFFISKYKYANVKNEKESIAKLEERFFEGIIDVIFKKSMNAYIKEN